MKKEILCTVCPRGCAVTVEGEGGRVESVSGNTCERGRQYASAEFVHPVRILTTTVRIKGTENELLPVRSSVPVPKELLFACMEEIRKAEAELPVSMYQVIIPDVLGTGADITATKTVEHI